MTSYNAKQRMKEILPSGVHRRVMCGHRPRHGAMLVLILIMLVGFMVAVAFSVDIAYMHLTRTELRTATDAAAKAAAVELSLTLNQGRAIQKGREIAAENLVSSDRMLVAPGDFSFGRSTETQNGKFRFAPGGTPLNSVQVNGRRTEDSPGGSIPLFFGNFLGQSIFEPTTSATATYIERDIVLVVDRSGSMRGQKFNDLVEAIDIFVATLNETPVDEQVGLASYNAQASEDSELTDNLPEISSSMAGLRVGGFTSISRGMTAGQNIMNRSRDANFVERTMIVMTDGRHNRGPEPAAVARQLAADNVVIQTITFGGNADRPRMQQVARIGGGNHFHADNGLQLREIYREIALTLNTVMTQ